MRPWILSFALLVGAVGFSVAPERATETATAFTNLSPPAQAALASKQAGRPSEAENWMVAAANPLAVEAGARVLREGGAAADAMIAVQLVLGLVEPQSSGLGGGAFLVWCDAASGQLTTLPWGSKKRLADLPKQIAVVFEKSPKPVSH